MNNARPIITRTVLLAIVVISLAGTRACQENYTVGGQAKVSASPSGSATETPSETPTSSASPTESPTDTDPLPTVTDTPSSTASPSETPEPSPTDNLEELGLNPVTQMPLGLRDKSDIANSANIVDLNNPQQVNRSKPENWLGGNYSGKEVGGQALDFDGDGYADWLENDLGSDKKNIKNIPTLPPVTSLVSRLKAVDRDGDGLSDREEQELGASPTVADSDSDGCSDGAEALSGSNPLDKQSIPFPDADRDCLSDEFEVSIGLNPSNQDTDSDGLRDDFELAIGSNPFKNDTDGDGILDGKEVSLGSDPTLPEYKRD